MSGLKIFSLLNWAARMKNFFGMENLNIDFEFSNFYLKKLV